MSDIPLENLDFAKVGAMQQPFTWQRFFFSWFVALFFHLFFFDSKFCLSLQGRGTFPCDISVLEIQQDLDWNPKVSTLNVWPLYICDDGAVVFYRLESKRMQIPPLLKWFGSLIFLVNFKNVFCCYAHSETAQRNPWSCRRMSAMSSWRGKAAGYWRLDTVSVIRLAKRRPSRSTWTEALPRTRDRSDAQSSTSCLFSHAAVAKEQRERCVSGLVLTWKSSSAVRLVCSHSPAWASGPAQKLCCAL